MLLRSHPKLNLCKGEMSELHKELVSTLSKQVRIVLQADNTSGHGRMTPSIDAV